MRALVVYESLWGNTAAVARAVAAGIGPETRAISTSEATPEELQGLELLVAGCPVIAFGVPTGRTLEGVRSEIGKSPRDPDLTQAPMESWLAGLEEGAGVCAAFDTRVRGPFGSAAPKLLHQLEHKGYRPVARPVGFRVLGKYGPLGAGELERARSWGQELAGKST